MKATNPAHPISSEPLINLLSRRSWEMGLLVFVTALIYLTLVPFDFVAGRKPFSGPGLLDGLRLSPISLSDISVNIALYIPLGALAVAVFRKNGASRVISAILSLALGSILSLLLEYTQRYEISRVASWSDVVSNTLGTGVGILIAIPLHAWLWGSRGKIAGAIRLHRTTVLMNVVVCAILAAQTCPYDVAIDLRRCVVQTIRHGDVRPWAIWERLPARIEAIHTNPAMRAAMLTRARCEFALDRFVDVALYAAVAALVVITARKSGHSRFRAFWQAGFVTLCLTATIVILRIFLSSYGFSTIPLAAGLIAWPIGVITATWCMRNLQSDSDHLSARRAGAVVICTVVALYELVPFNWRPFSGTLAMFNWVPFAWHFESRVSDAFHAIALDLMRYALVGASLSLAAGRIADFDWRRHLAGLTTIIGLASLAVQIAHRSMPSRHADATHVWLAMAAAAAGITTVRWARDYLAANADMFRTADDTTYRCLPEGSGSILAT